MCYNIGMDEEEDFIISEEGVIPYVRIYITVGKANHDMLEIDEIIDALTQDNKSPSENIKDIIDKGMVNIYACTFNETVKVL
jgi:hypothetical protein